MIDEEMNQGEFSLPAVSDPASVSEPAPAPEVTPEPVTAPVPEPIPPMEVISVDELLERLTQGSDEAEPVPEESQDPAEPSPGEPGDTVAVELDPGTLAVMEAMDGFQDELAELSGQLTEIQQHLFRPALTTPFEDYTVTETLLLLLLLSAFAAVCFKMLKGGFKWLRS